MKLTIWYVTAVVVVAAAFWGWSKYGDARLDTELDSLHTIDDPQEAVASAAGYLRNHPDLDEN